LIVLDTNVVSEPMRPRGDQRVISWVNQQAPATLYITATVLAELLLGVDNLPEGRRKTGIARDLADFIASLFHGRILPFDERSAAHYATIVGSARRAGRAIGIANGQVAAVAARHGFAVATRDTTPFEAAGLRVIDPWMT
jgi:hypothetical protein